MLPMKPKPGPEVQKLGCFAGTWTTEGTIAPGPWGAGGKFSWTETTEWMSGNFFVVGQWDFQMPPELGGDGKEIFFMVYDTNQYVYTFDAFSSQGRHQVSRGTVKWRHLDLDRRSHLRWTECQAGDDHEDPAAHQL
jgi:hypothetical protein